MLKDIIKVKPLSNYRLQIEFEDGVHGIIHVATLIKFTGIFAPLSNPAYFAQVHINPDWGTVTWSNEADLDPDVLYSQLTGEPLPTVEPALA